MRKIGIVTINDDNNYGNKLQNYAVQKTLTDMGFNTITLLNNPCTNDKNKFILRIIKNILKRDTSGVTETRKKYFKNFNRNINYSSKIINAFSKLSNYDFFVTGSDQVWNPNFGRLRDVDLLKFTTPSKRISFSASFGISNLPERYNEKLKNALKNYKAISVREDAGKKIIQDVVGRTDVEVLVDPTMLLTAKEWDKVSKKPEQLKTNKYILNYFLGELSEERKKEIQRIADENNCEVINILDINSPFYETGPSEFLYLEKNAFLICTDSFHSSVFAILYNRPFIVFDRDGGKVSINSRLKTLLSKFKLENRWYRGHITDELLKVDYTETYKILDIERKKSEDFLKRALDIEE